MSDLFDKTTQDRILVGFRLAVVVFFVAAVLLNMDPHWLRPGLVVSITGMILQLWVMGSERSRNAVPIDGPYLFVRHPAYIARFVFVLGLVLMMGTPWVLLAFVAVYVPYAVNRVIQQEQAWHDRFGTEYLRYSRHVPCYLPRLKPYPEGRFWFFSMKSFRRRYGEIFLLLSVVLYISCYTVAFHWP